MATSNSSLCTLWLILLVCSVACTVVALENYAASELSYYDFAVSPACLQRVFPAIPTDKLEPHHTELIEILSKSRQGGNPFEDNHLLRQYAKQYGIPKVLHTLVSPVHTIPSKPSGPEPEEWSTSIHTSKQYEADQIVADPSVSNSALAPPVDLSRVDLSSIKRMCPQDKCGFNSTCKFGPDATCCNADHCCPPGATCLTTNPPTCVYDAPNDPYRCPIELCAVNHHCPHLGVLYCCTGGTTCCKYRYMCQLSRTDVTCVLNTSSTHVPVPVLQALPQHVAPVKPVLTGDLLTKMVDDLQKDINDMENLGLVSAKTVSDIGTLEAAKLLDEYMKPANTSNNKPAVAASKQAPPPSPQPKPTAPKVDVKTKKILAKLPPVPAAAAPVKAVPSKPITAEQAKKLWDKNNCPNCVKKLEKWAKKQIASKVSAINKAVAQQREQVQKMLDKAAAPKRRRRGGLWGRMRGAFKRVARGFKKVAKKVASKVKKAVKRIRLPRIRKPKFLKNFGKKIKKFGARIRKRSKSFFSRIKRSAKKVFNKSRNTIFKQPDANQPSANCPTVVIRGKRIPLFDCGKKKLDNLFKKKSPKSNKKKEKSKPKLAKRGPRRPLVGKPQYPALPGSTAYWVAYKPNEADLKANPSNDLANLSHALQNPDHPGALFRW